MPDIEEDTGSALAWLTTRLLKDLGTAKLWPVKMAHVKRQDDLRRLHETFCCRLFVYKALNCWIWPNSWKSPTSS